MRFLKLNMVAGFSVTIKGIGALQAEGRRFDPVNSHKVETFSSKGFQLISHLLYSCSFSLKGNTLSNKNYRL